MARLPQVLPPRRGESVHGYVRRLAEINGITLSAVMKLAEVGRIKPASDEKVWEKLAEAAAIDLDALEKMRRLPANVPGAPGAVTFMGHAVRPSHLTRDDMRVCPQCVRSGGTLREVWSVSQITCCPQHECLLVDSCDACGRKLKFHNAGSEDAWSCVCDKELADLPTIPASELTLAAARLLYPVVGRTEITGYISLARAADKGLPPFDTLCLNDLLAAMDLIGTVATTPAEEDEVVGHFHARYGSAGPARRVKDIATRTEAALRIMRAWPEAWYDVLDDLASRSPLGASHLIDRAILATRMGRRCLAPDRGLDGIPLQVITKATTAWLKDRHGFDRRKRPTSARNSIALMIGRAMPADTIAQHIGIEPYRADYRRIYQAALEAMVAEGVNGTPAELGADVLQRVQHRWQELNATVSSVTASDMIEGSVAEKGLKGWDHPDLILPATGFDDLARKRKASYSVADIEHMLQRLRDVSVRIDDLEGLDHLTTGVMRRTLTPHYDKTALLLDVLSGRVPTYRTVDQPRLRDLYASLPETNRRAVSCRAMALADADVMLASKPLNNMLEVLWGAGHRLGVKESRALREGGQVRFEVETLWNATEQRSHPSYSYSVADTLRHMYASAGACGVPELNAFLRQAALVPMSQSCNTMPAG
ncbi:TniQ family protein [uncultured Sphingobium sp.]|uniref:TniQ family protein n=1 Tax=uncultured Sphingobium sp. TaxID=316087 RepID=UPI00261A04B3|nr:TniQ family protein [uncultured Sphingobium sp.]